MHDLQQRDATANGIRVHYVEAGNGPLVLLCHGFPEGWYSWRDQLSAIAGAGFRAVAPDMRGYGGTEAPADISAYSVMDIVGDMIGLLGALGERQAVIIGHDWGANIAWHAALFRPDVFPAVAALSVPFRQRSPAPPLQMLRKAGQLSHYWFHFQEPGIAEAEFERDPRAALRRVLYSISGDAPAETRRLTLQPGKGWLANTIDPERLPTWLTDADLDHMATEFSRSGFRGGLNWYRNIDRNWELTAPWAGALIRQPALFIAGSLDPVIASGSGDSAVQALATTVPGLTRKLLIDGAGHFIQQERPQLVNEAILEFLTGLPAREG
ncbi:MAG: alpha/beta hydrolase [Gammaproteobacteria bacterium]